MTLAKIDIVEKVHTQLGFQKKESVDLVGSVIALIKTPWSQEKIKISGFGNFEVKHKKDRKGRNPQTAETITIEARKILSFKPSMILRQAVNK